MLGWWCKATLHSQELPVLLIGNIGGSAFDEEVGRSSDLQQVATAAGGHCRATAHATVSGVSCGVDPLGQQTTLLSHC